jgi:hypothetical protein
VSFKAPELDCETVCIVDRTAVHLAALVSSYLATPGKYFALFEFPNIRHGRREGADVGDDDYFSNIVATEESIFISNSLARMGQPKRVILAGLSSEQKSYLRIDSTDIVDISTAEEVPHKLGALGVRKEHQLRCNADDLVNGLYLAATTDSALVLDDTAPALKYDCEKENGIVVVERIAEHVAIVVATNYAIASDASVVFVDAMLPHEQHDIVNSLRAWKEQHSDDSFQRVMHKIMKRVGNVDFRPFGFATFFTEGLPYSLGLRNFIPCSNVSLRLRPDHLIVNAILAERMPTISSAIVFSLGDQPDEAHWLDGFLGAHKFIVRVLFGANATIRNLDYNAQHFPYGILHIATHGNEIDGYSTRQTFTDRQGAPHTVEFDEVVGLSLVPGTDQVEVVTKSFLKSLDASPWGSPELKDQQLPEYVYSDMTKALATKEQPKGAVVRAEKRRVPGSSSIRCIDGDHLGMVRSLASHDAPFVFNNSCWSWSYISEFFLSAGARAYIGTLWAIDNLVAARAAKAIYTRSLGGMTLAEALQTAVQEITNDDQRDIYVLWGLHFSTLREGRSLRESLDRVFGRLSSSVFRWIEAASHASTPDVKNNALSSGADPTGPSYKVFRNQHGGARSRN